MAQVSPGQSESCCSSAKSPCVRGWSWIPQMENMNSKDQRPILGRDLQRATLAHGLPAGGHWFWKQTPMLKHIEEHGGVSLSWEKTVKGTRFFAV